MMPKWPNMSRLSYWWETGRQTGIEFGVQHELTMTAKYGTKPRTDRHVPEYIRRPCNCDEEGNKRQSDDYQHILGRMVVRYEIHPDIQKWKMRHVDRVGYAPSELA